VAASKPTYFESSDDDASRVEGKGRAVESKKCHKVPFSRRKAMLAIVSGGVTVSLLGTMRQSAETARSAGAVAAENLIEADGGLDMMRVLQKARKSYRLQSTWWLRFLTA